MLTRPRLHARRAAFRLHARSIVHAMATAITETTALERHIRETIPLARAIDLRVGEYDGYRLQLSGPLGPNINDKGCAFGGSITSLLTLAGWGLINLKLGEAGIHADVFVQDASVLYLAPIW